MNDKIKVVDSIKTLNEKLHSDGINEKLRSQFVGTCLLALKNGLVFKNVKETLDPKTGKKLAPERVVLKSIKNILEGLLTRGGSLNKAGKLAVLNSKVLDDQDVTSLTYKELEDILQFIDDNVVPYINDKSTAGQDLLNLFFTTFNKYVGKSDKNQAFTPDHICDFMSKAVGVNKNSRVLDPCCGSGAFLVRAMTDAMDDCDTEEEREEVKKNQIFGIEYEEGAFGLSSTNMLIHGDGNSNVVQDSMFKRAKWIAENNINIVLMNPPYNATKKCCDPDYTKGWDVKKKEDPSKGLHFVEWVARHVPSTCKMAVLLPMQAAIGNSEDIKAFKKKMMDALYLKDNEFNEYTGLFVATVIMHDRYRWDYGRKWRPKRMVFSEIKLPIMQDENGNAIIDKDHKYSPAGFLPDWEYMEKYIRQLHSKRISTAIKSQCRDMKLADWKQFKLTDLFDICRGNGLSRIALDDGSDNGINFISRQSYNNGVNSVIGRLENVKPFDGGCITVALGGEYLGSSFVQLKPFYTGAHMAVLTPKDAEMTLYSKLFICTLIRFESKIKYCAFGRELDTHIDREFSIKLPVRIDGNPDWDWMDAYMKSLPYSDRL